MKRLILLFISLPILSIAQQTYVPDNNFEAYLETHDASGTTVPLGDPAAMGDGIIGNDSVTTANINTVTFLDVSGGAGTAVGIFDLTGIEDFAALTFLSCFYNNIITLDISNNTFLDTLICFSNQLTTLDISNNTGLIYLACWDNQLTSLDISNKISLSYLECSANQLTSIDLSNNINLISFYCNSNLLNNLDISNNTAIINLDASVNQLTTLDVSNNIDLNYFNFFLNQLTSIDISNNTDLTFLSCWDNQLISLDVSNNTALNSLDCSANELSCLNLKNGNNFNFIQFTSTNNQNLTCIEVDDPVWATANWLSTPNPFAPNIDAGVTFNTNCNYPVGCITTSIQENISNTSIHPNPTNDFINLDVNGYNGSIQTLVYDLSGRLLQTTNSTTISLKDYAKGVYVFRVSYGDRVEELKVVKE